MTHPTPSSESAEMGAAGEAKQSSRAKHLAWCKARALDYVDQGDTQGAFASMASDLQKHPETEGHIGVQIGMMQMMGGMLSSRESMRRFIEGFN